MQDDQRAQLLDAVWKYHQDTRAGRAFIPGVTRIWPSGSVFEAVDRIALAEAALGMGTVAGHRAEMFESTFAHRMGCRTACLTDSGSSAGITAVSALMSHLLEDRRLRPGDEVISVAVGSPATVKSLMLNGLVPVFVDVEPRTCTTTADLVARAAGPRTRAMIVPHTLGNPCEVREIAELAFTKGLFLIEDNGDALGSTYDGRLTGTFGDLTTVAFCPGHHLTMGDAGCVLTADPLLAQIVESLNGRAPECWCAPAGSTSPPDHDPEDLAHHVGFTLRPVDLQAALGVTQLAKFDDSCAARRHNWCRLREGLDGLPHLSLPTATPRSDPSWTGFAITVEPGAPFSRTELVAFLESRMIGTRRLFMDDLARNRAHSGRRCRVAGDMATSENIAEHTFWTGVHPGLTDEMTEYVIESIQEFVTRRVAPPPGRARTPSPAGDTPAGDLHVR